MTYANIGNPSDVGAALINDAEGIGLFRSEFIYLAGQDYPSELTSWLLIRVLWKTWPANGLSSAHWTRADKQADYFNLPHEEKPGYG